MKQTTLTIEGKEWKFFEHQGFVQFPSLSRTFWDRPKGSPNLDVIAKFDSMGYDLISESFINMIFKKRSDKIGLKTKDGDFWRNHLTPTKLIVGDDRLFIFCNKAITITIKGIFQDLKKAFPKTLQPLGTKKETMIPKWKAIMGVRLLIDELERRYLAKSQNKQ